ncbi:sensor histidine kinase [Nocardioides sp. CFH 31398]|uniref:MadS family sensor histidine kinase n=1 Tax=Nocardioides sp. CFH 31398 TaxID=2919579 RepID=UPI001F060125|nr:GAF domain-containing sensor histidine kinase [Nocardioides sp. CFH 31398]MCH1865851.1 histidine kinase [Nocardioides sp. CFH 31398]
MATTADLSVLTGVRSGKRSYYRAYVRSDERTQRAVRAMDSISRALVRTHEGPRGLLEEVVRAAAEHLEADWTMLAVADGHLPGARPRFLALAGYDGGPDGAGEFADDDAALPDAVRAEVSAVRAGLDGAEVDDPRWVRVPMTLEGRCIGSLVARHDLPQDPEAGDLAVLRILANQAAVSLHTSEQYHAGLVIHRRAQRLYDEAQAQARDLAQRTAELRHAEDRLLLADQRELVDAERHRIARELHDSVTQFVLSAGMVVEVARGDAEQAGAHEIGAQLERAKALTAEAVDQLRRAIYALHQPHSDRVSTLPELLHEVAEHHRPRLDVRVRVEGKDERGELGVDAVHEIARAVGEALFNVAHHAGATRSMVRVRYRPTSLLVSVADDGAGDPTRLSRLLREQRGHDVDGRHRGLANMEARLAGLGGNLAFRRARMGGVRVEMRVPLPLCDAGRPGLISGLVTDGRTPAPSRGGT